MRAYLPPTIRSHHSLSHKAGFSLVELTIVVGLVALLAVAISSIVLVTIIQTTRVRNQIRTRQVGDYTIGQLQTMIRNAREVVACDSTANALEIGNPDGDTTLFIEETVGLATAIASNSGQYLTTQDTTTNSTFDLECLPSDTTPNLVKVSFDLQKIDGGERATENPAIHYETSVEIRNY